jgi:glycosyltransferase involved in cell wall biosynthesis
MAGRLNFLESWLNDIEEDTIEVFLVHDVQDEKTSAELQHLLLKQKKPNIIFSEGIFGTAGIARNSVLNLCKGQWVVFWDSDDTPNLENVLSAIDNSFDVIIGEFQIREPNGELRYFPHGHDYKSSIKLMSFQPGLWRIIFRKEAIAGVRFPSFKMGEDQDFLAQINWNKTRIKFEPTTFYTYNVGQFFQTTASKNSRDSLIDSITFLSNLIGSSVGTESFIRNLASRQFFTLIKDSKLRIRIRAVRAFLGLFKSPKNAIRQLSSILVLVSFLVRAK